MSVGESLIHINGGFFMETQASIDQIIENLIPYLESIGYSPSTIGRYRKLLKGISSFFKDRHISTYGSKENEEYLKFLVGNGNYRSLSSYNKEKYRASTILLEYSLYGIISCRAKHKEEEVEGNFSDIINSFERYRLSRGLSKGTVKGQMIHLKRLRIFLKEKNINDLSQLQNDHILDFIKTFVQYSESKTSTILSVLRIFLKFLNEQGYHEKDLSYLVPKSTYKSQTKLPTTYTPEEIKKMLESIDRGNPKGKRDYAMVLLCARLGLRASDVCLLQFSEVNWEKNVITLDQKKTGNTIELPLLPEVGNAIIDYLKFGRPQSENSHVFLEAGYRCTPITPSTLYTIVRSCLLKAGIEIENKKSGPHSLRHSLASQLLENKSPLPVISSVLGHESSESTKCYLRIDISALRSCALPVPPLENQYYDELEAYL